MLSSVIVEELWRTKEERKEAHRVLVGKPEGKRQLWRPRRRWEDNIRRDLKDSGCYWVDGM